METAAGRAPIFAGVTTLNTRETVRQLRQMRDTGADGAMLGLPMWQEIDVPGAVQFYRDVAEAVPELAICIYANPEAFKFSFPTPFWAQVAEIPQVVSTKYINIAQLTARHHGRRANSCVFCPWSSTTEMLPEWIPSSIRPSGLPVPARGPELTMHWRDIIREAGPDR